MLLFCHHHHQQQQQQMGLWDLSLSKGLDSLVVFVGLLMSAPLGCTW
jgi:hypothetical protein